MQNDLIELSVKQAQYIREANKRWNGKVGATQCGKTYIDTLYIIPHRIVERAGKSGLSFIVGVSKETIQRNVIEPLQEIYGDKVVTGISSNNTCQIFGEKVYCIGADNVGRVRKFRGPRVKYLYIDEAYDINREVFELLKTRLSFEYSCCDFAGNPQSPNHWFEEFINSDVDIYLQRYSLFDNPFLPQKYVDELCRELKGTVYYDRYILGLAKNAEGLIYTPFVSNPDKFLMGKDEVDDLFTKSRFEIHTGIDFGGNKSATTFVANAIFLSSGIIVSLASERHLNADYKNGITPDILDELVDIFVRRVQKKYDVPVNYIFWDNENTTLGNGIKNYMANNFGHIDVYPCLKKPIKDRIYLTIRLMAQERYFYTEDCDTLKKAFLEAMWEGKTEDKRLDDFSSDIDSLDAFEYGFTKRMKELINE